VFIIGMFWKRTAPRAGFWGILVGTIASAGLYVLHINDVVQFRSDTHESLWGGIAAFVAAAITVVAVTPGQAPKREEQLAGLVQGWGLSPVMVVAAIMLFYVVLGSVMDELSMILLTIPIFFPMVIGLDFGMPKESVAIWFGIMVLMTVGFGLLAPPVGLNVYVVNGMAKDVPIAESYRGVMPFLVSDTIRTIVLLLFPPISLWLVKFIG